jgi:transposase InsO family protein
MFVVASASFRLLYVMISLTHDRRRIIHTAVTEHATAGWLSRQLTEAFPWDTAPRYLLRDRDVSYGRNFRRRVDAMGITEVVTAPCSPWQNAYVERVIGSIRRECLDHIVIFNERHLPRPLLVCGLLPKHPDPSFARQGLSQLTPDHDTQDREGRRHPKSRGPASPLRTSRRLIRPRCLLANGCVPSGTPSADDLCVGRSFEFD